MDDTPFSIGVGSIQARKAYFPDPDRTDGFYSGNTDPLAAIDEATYGDEYREDYYAWEWGDALFVVIDEYQYTMNLPYTPAAGEGTDDSVTGNQWSWTLGQQQYNWLKQTLENSDAKYKFVFSHHMLGGIPSKRTLELERGMCAAAPRQRDILSGAEKTPTARLGFRHPAPRLGRRPDPPVDGGKWRQRLLPRSRSPVCLRDARRHRLPGSPLAQHDRFRIQRHIHCGRPMRTTRRLQCAPTRVTCGLRLPRNWRRLTMFDLVKRRRATRPRLRPRTRLHPISLARRMF